MNKIKDMYDRLHFDLLLIVEPMIQSKGNSVQPMGIRDFTDGIIHNGVEKPKPTFG